MVDQERPVWTAQEFAAWRARMGWSMSQAAHVLMVSKPSILAWENGTYPVDPHVIHLCDSAELLRTLRTGAFSGNALEIIFSHHAALETRMAEAAEMPGRGRPRVVKLQDGTHGLVTGNGPGMAPSVLPGFSSAEEAEANIDGVDKYLLEVGETVPGRVRRRRPRS